MVKVLFLCLKKSPKTMAVFYVLNFNSHLLDMKDLLILKKERISMNNKNNSKLTVIATRKRKTTNKD